MNAKIKRLVSGLLVASMTVGLFPIYAAADTGLCEHHTEHADCGFVAAFAGEDCTHAHDDGCYTEVTDCVHVHGDCGYIPAMEGASCDHTHDESCGFSEGTPAQGQCSHVCSCESGCIRKELSCPHVHDETCGYREAVEGQPCTFVCEQCQLQNEEPPVCSCDSKCSDGSVKADCPVCAAEGADLTLCTGKEAEKNEAAFTTGRVTDTIHILPDIGLPDNQELFQIFAEQQFYGYQMSTFGVAAREKLRPMEKEVYDLLRPKLEEVANEGGSTEFTIEQYHYYTIDELAEQGLKKSDFEDVDAFYSAVIAHFRSAFEELDVAVALMHDMPFHMYWYDKAYGGVSASVAAFETDASEGKVYIDLEIAFTVNEDFRSKENPDKYVVGDDMKRVNLARENARKVVDTVQGKEDIEKISYFKEYICEVVSYHDEAGKDDYDGYGEPFQMISVFDEDPNTKVVCEGYSKAFQYLCDISDLQNTECICVVGDFGGSDHLGGHMWNMVTYAGKNYLVDITNCDDDSAGYPDKLFLVGGDYIEDVYQGDDGPKGGYQYTFGATELIYVCDDLNLVPGSKITCSVTGEGTVEPSKTSAAAGETITLTFKPEPGYNVSEVTVKDAKGTEIALEKYTDGSREFEMPGSDVTVSVVFGYTMLVAEYEYNISSDDAHQKYPTGMKVWEYCKEGDEYYRNHLTRFDDILKYFGCAIRIVGEKGIRMRTAIPTQVREELIEGRIEGYTLLEYGTVVAWASDLKTPENLTLDHPDAKSNFAYKKGVADPVYAEKDGLTMYTNVLVKFDDEECKKDLVMRPYMKLQDVWGNEQIIYGGPVQRSIGYIAWQNRNDFTPGSAAYEYIWDIIHVVYGDQHDNEYKKG